MFSSCHSASSCKFPKKVISVSTFPWSWFCTETELPLSTEEKGEGLTRMTSNQIRECPAQINRATNSSNFDHALRLRLPMPQLLCWHNCLFPNLVFHVHGLGTQSGTYRRNSYLLCGKTARSALSHEATTAVTRFDSDNPGLHAILRDSCESTEEPLTSELPSSPSAP